MYADAHTHIHTPSSLSWCGWQLLWNCLHSWQENHKFLNPNINRQCFDGARPPRLNINSPLSVSDLQLHGQPSPLDTQPQFHPMQWIPLRMHWWTRCIASPQASHTKASQLSAKRKTSCMSIKSRLLLSCTICKTYFLPALCSHLTPQQSTLHHCAKLEATHWNHFTGGVWLYFQTSLDWLAFVPLACVRCFAPPPSSGPHLHPSTGLADLLIHAINYVSLLVCEFWLKVFPDSGSNLTFFFFLFCLFSFFFF